MSSKTIGIAIFATILFSFQLQRQVLPSDPDLDRDVARTAFNTAAFENTFLATP